MLARARSESHDLDGWNPYQDSEPTGLLPNLAEASLPNPSPMSIQSLTSAVVPNESPVPRLNHANDPSQKQ